MGWAIIAVIVAGVLLANLMLHLGFALLVRPFFERAVPFNVEPSEPDSRAERISFKARDGITLRGSLYARPEEESRGLILFCPEHCGDHWSAMNYCAGLWDAGFDILSFAFRNQGESDSLPGYAPRHWLTSHEVSDTLSAIKYIASRPDLAERPLGLFGISRGGCAALAATARTPAVRAVACEGVFSTDSLMQFYAMRWASLYLPGWALRLLPNWHINLTLRLTVKLSAWRQGHRYPRIESLLRRLPPRPALMIAGGRDTYVPAEITRAVCRAAGSSCQGVWTVPEARHNMARKIDPEGYDRRLVELFACLSGTGTRDGQTSTKNSSVTSVGQTLQPRETAGSDSDSDSDPDQGTCRAAG